jgi:hypothetical protein
MTNANADAPATDLRYPVGRFTMPSAPLTDTQRVDAIAAIAALPAQFRAAVAGLTPEQLDTPYRPGGWTVRQLIHHVADSHMNGFIRLKLALTEDAPTIKTYDETRWAELADVRLTPPEVSLSILDGVHVRWVNVWRSLAPDQFATPFTHPDHGRMRIEQHLALYAWHGRHHTAHVTTLREREGW